MLQVNFEEDRIDATEVVPLSSLTQVHHRNTIFFLELNFISGDGDWSIVKEKKNICQKLPFSGQTEVE